MIQNQPLRLHRQLLEKGRIFNTPKIVIEIDHQTVLPLADFAHWELACAFCIIDQQEKAIEVIIELVELNQRILLGPITCDLRD